MRDPELKLSDVEQAQFHDRSVVRTWAFRGTLHLLAVEDLEWLLPLLGPYFVRADSRRHLELGLDEATCERAIREIHNALAAQGPLSRSELARHLSDKGLPAEGQAVPHVLSRAALEGSICLGPERRGKPTYTLLSDWIGKSYSLTQHVSSDSNGSISGATSETLEIAQSELVKR